MSWFSLPRYKNVLLIGDLLFILLCLELGQWRSGALYFLTNNYNWFVFISFSILFILIWGISLQLNGLYKIRNVLSNKSQLIRIINSTFYVFLGYAVIVLLGRPNPWIDKRSITVLVFFFTPILLSFWRLILFRWLWISTLSGEHYRRKMAVIGSGEGVNKIIQRLKTIQDHDIWITGIIDDNRIVKSLDKNNSTVLGTVERIESILEKQSIDIILIASEHLKSSEILEITERCTRLGKEVNVISSSYEIVVKKWETEEFAGIPVVRLSGARYNTTILKGKRFIDFLFSLIGLLVLSPFLILIALGIKITSKGPVIYSQMRIGKDGRMFDFYKFRSMFVEGEKEDEEKRKVDYQEFMRSGEPREKIVNALRITTVGRFLRKYSLDELPQLWNVVIGDMSLVGPRPALPYEFEKYSEWQKKRFAVLPGCTGLWQVSDRMSMSFDDMVLLDFYYIENISPWLDFLLILKTFPVMIFGVGGR